MTLLGGSKPRKSKRGGSRTLPPAVSGAWTGVNTHVGTPLLYRNGDLLYAMQNMYIPDVAKRLPAESRPSVTRVGTLQLGSGSDRQGQEIFEHVRADGTIDRIFFAGGKMYRWNGSIVSPSITDITPAATTISKTSRIYCCSFNEKIIVTDGVNTPWAYNPVAATRAFIDIDGSSTAWVARARPFVYAAKLFFIVASVGTTSYTARFVWSEEADETIGYVQTGGGTTYTNKWDISQTNQNQLTAAIATNLGIYYFRPESIGFISGQVNASFQTTATHDAISSTVGTVTPDAVIIVDGGIGNEDVYFVDRYIRQWRITRNGLEPLWKALDDATFGFGPGPTVSSVYYPEFGVVLTNQLTAHVGSRTVWDVATGASFGYWYLPIQRIRAMGVVRDEHGNPTMIMIGQAYDDTEGYVYRFLRNAENAPASFDDTLWPLTTLHQRWIGVVLGDDLRHDQRFTSLTAEVYNPLAPATCNYFLRVSGSDRTATCDTTGDALADRVTWGTNEFGRRLKAVVGVDDRANPRCRIARIVATRIDEGYHPDSP